MMVQNEQGAWYENNHPPIGDCSLMLAAAKDAEIERLKAVLGALVNKLDAISEDSKFQAIFAMYQIHGGKYTGPNWSEELQRAREATK